MPLLVLLSCLLALAAGGTRPDPARVPPRAASWDELCAAGFEPAWRLADGLREATGVEGAPRQDLAEAIDRLARLEVLEDGEAFAFGDLLAELAVVRRDERATAEWLAQSRVRHAGLFAQAGLPLEELLTTWRVYGDWDPGWDAPDDGLVHLPPLSLEHARREPWRSIDGASRVQQVATIVFAEPGDVLAVAHDFPGYLEHVSSDYESIAPRRDGHWRGTDDAGAGFVAVQLDVRCDLPFPFGGYGLQLWVLDQVRPDGDIVTHMYSRSPDFRWLAGRDLLVPVFDGRGRPVATLAVRQQGFDLAGVPEDDDIRRSALRAGLGNFKRRAEERAARRPAAPRPGPHGPDLPGPPLPRLPDFEVRGPG
jgi:hypothetical protein